MKTHTVEVNGQAIEVHVGSGNVFEDLELEEEFKLTSMANPFEDNPNIEPVPMKPFVRSPLEPNELFRGQAWSVYLEDGRYELNYLTGHLAECERRLPISKREAEQLMSGDLNVEEVLRAYGAD